MKIRLLAIGLCFFASAAQAEVVNYDCELHSIEAQGWIPSRVWLSVDAENKRARVYDGAIREDNRLNGQNDEKPKDAKFKVNRRGEYQLSWRISLVASAGGQLRVSYTGMLNPQTNEFEMIARFPQANVSNRPSGVGRCKAVNTPALY